MVEASEASTHDAKKDNHDTTIIPSSSSSSTTKKRSSWLSRQRDRFGYPFLTCCCAVYFAQGFRSLSSLSVQFLLKDTLRLEPAAIQALLSTAGLPWSIKPLYGIVSDSFPIGGRHRKPYLVVAAGVGVVAWSLLAWITSSGGAMTTQTTTTMGGGGDVGFSNDGTKVPFLSSGVVTALLFLSNFSTALADVIVDAMVAERSGEAAREKNGRTGSNRDKGFTAATTAATAVASEGEDALQALCWGSLAIGGLVGSLLGILAVSSVPPWVILLSTAICPAFVLAASYTLIEVPKGCETVSLDRKDNNMRSSSSLKIAKAGYEAVGRQLTAVSSALSQPLIWRPMLFFFLSHALVPSCKQALFFFTTDVLKFSPEFLSAQSLIGYVFLLAGTAFYSRFVRRAGWTYSTIFVYTKLAKIILCLMDTALVSRLTYTHLHLPDRIFVLGTDVFGTVLSRMSSQPFYLLSARLCPSGCEATLYALFMSTSNFGHTVGGMWGAVLASWFGVRRGEYDGLTGLMLFRAFCAFLPLLLIRPLLRGVDQLKGD